MSDLKRAIQILSKTNTGFDAILELATVKSVNKLEMTCNVTLNDNEDLLLEGVKLKPVVPGVDLTSMGIVCYPSEGSKVVIGQINNSDSDLFVVCYGGLDSIALDAGLLFSILLNLQSGLLAVTIPSISLNGGNNGGLPKINPLVSKLNQLEKTLNDLIGDFKGHKHSGVSTGGGFSGTSDKSGPTVIQPTNINEIENKAILQ